ncbi:Bud site selection protein bud4 [Sporothrix curviconia]|uniref:Bud site selection protein bud4 n=1 Tax=Sporothrix curviconia TaxID=1260050 RepID=A0ABP0CU70_9PEZI
MASTEPVHPLRISKNNTPMSSPAKKASAIPRPLSEISPSEKRRNSPSWNQTNKKLGLNADSSPFQSSPLDSTTSPRLFWQTRNGFNSENLYGGGIGGSPSPTRRSSIERLQKASRVKNSSILAQEQKNEYDPTKIPRVERPLSKVQSNSFGALGIISPPSNETKSHHRSDSKTHIPLYNPAKASPSAASLESPPHIPGQLSSSVQSFQSDKSDTPAATAADSAPVMATKEPSSPIKSSLSSRFKSSYDEHADFSLDVTLGEYDLPQGRSLHRHAKSVTFDAAPPQVNEYEMATPDLSSVGSNSREGSYESQEDEDDYDDYRYSAHDHGNPDDSFDASLEDTDKTPVVGPDDWRQDSPDSRRGHHMFDGSPMPDAIPTSAVGHQDAKSALGSSGDHRPLPPLPGMGHVRTNSATSPGLPATAERMLGGSPRGLPSPPPAATTKSEIQSIGNSKMTLEERLKLMMLSDDGKSAAELQRERRMRRAGAKDRANSQTPEPDTAQQHDAHSEHGEEDDTLADLSGLEEYRLPPRISRESILRRVNGAIGHERESDYNFTSPAPSSSPERRLPLDPDVPIPSTERDDDDDNISIDDGAANGKHDEAYDIPDMYGNEDDEEAGDYESNYSEDIGSVEPEVAAAATTEGVSTSRAATPVQEIASSHTVTVDDIRRSELPAIAQEGRISLGETRLPAMPKPAEAVVETIIDTDHLHMSEPQVVEVARPQTPERKIQAKHLSKPEYDGSGWGDDEEFDDEPGTPDSVIHHPVQNDDEDDIFDDDQEMQEEQDEEEEMEEQESPAVPEQMATIKASGSKLKTRPSATPSDLVAMREARRQVSREIPDVPPIPDRHRNRLSRDMGTEAGQEGTGEDFLERHPSFKNRSLTLDLDLGLSLDQDFERVIEAQKRGYLMRQNTKLVAASDKNDDDFRGARSAGNSPVKKDRPQSWTVEPWNGERRKSIKKRPAPSGPVPPMPGQESNATALNPLAEEEYVTETTTDEGAERGRLFVKVMGVKDLDLPISRTERTWFSLTLDNGVHCVTTAWLELARNAPIGQEFELLVPNDLEFQLTLNVKLEKPVQKKIVQASPVKTVRPKTSTFSRVFASPKKRKEMEQRMKEEDERIAREQHEAQAKVRNTVPTAYDLLSPLVAEDGSFARAYVCLKEHESRCYGRPGIVDIACFNEWATEEASFASSVKSKRGNMAVVRRAPYKIGKLELQLLFVPRPKGISNDDMPKSMNSCIREMKAAEERQSQNWEGHLSQQGGDCPYWRRRYFKLVGTKLTAYHEATRQPRATINLANAKRLIDDRRALTEKETTGKNGRRRRSAFAEEEEGYMFVEEGFRIRFNNGEVIDFYADTAEDKEGWMKVLSEVTARDSFGGDDDAAASRAKTKWCELVLKREEALRRRAEGRRVHSRTKSMYV